jgi:leader peptidase (prepilin peptidase)/N-methyltransferase
MYLIEFLHNNTAAYLTVIAIISLMIGSFLNVVIYRLPIMLEKEWREQCNELINGQNTSSNESSAINETDESYNLMLPRSACTHCGHKITALENIPVISYLFLRGKCSECGTSISIRYPIIEIVTAILTVFIAWHYGFTLQAALAMLLTWSLICLAMIDFDHKLLPDAITLPMLWLGLLVSLGTVFVDTRTSLIGAAAGYMVLWTIFKAHNLITGKEGMGYGDFKLLAMLGAWMGWSALPVVILFSSFVGAAVGISLILFRGRDKNIPIPFGPYIAAAGWITLIWGNDIISTYLEFSGLNRT